MGGFGHRKVFSFQLGADNVCRSVGGSWSLNASLTTRPGRDWTYPAADAARRSCCRTSAVLHTRSKQTARIVRFAYRKIVCKTALQVRTREETGISVSKNEKLLKNFISFERRRTCSDADFFLRSLPNIVSGSHHGKGVVPRRAPAGHGTQRSQAAKGDFAGTTTTRQKSMADTEHSGSVSKPHDTG